MSHKVSTWQRTGPFFFNTSIVRHQREKDKELPSGAQDFWVTSGTFEAAATSNVEKRLLLSRLETNGLFGGPLHLHLWRKGQKGNENALTVQHWMSLISQFSLCFAASLGTILGCVFKSNCHLRHQHSVDPGI